MVPLILLVDDEVEATDALRRSFHGEPWRILVAHSGREALNIMATEAVDVILVDQEMPGMTGTELLSHLRQQYPDAVRMMLTGHARLDLAMRAIDQGDIYRFFVKPVSSIDLTVSVRQALQAKMLQDENRRLQATVREQAALLDELEQANPGITRVQRDADGVILIEDED